MFKGWKHTIVCSKCGESKVQFDEYDTAETYINKHKSECCNSDYEYIGLQPHYHNILKVPVEIKENMPIDTNDEIQEMICQEKQEILVIEEISTGPVLVGNVDIKIEDIITPGARGVSNAQMIPALKQAINEGSKAKLDLLKQHYPDIYDSSVKYLPGKLQKILEDIR